MLEITDDTAVIADDVAAPPCSLSAPDTAGRRAAEPGVRHGPVVGRALSSVMMDRVPSLLAAAAASLLSASLSVVIPPVISGLAESLDRPLLSLADYTY